MRDESADPFDIPAKAPAKKDDAFFPELKEDDFANVPSAFEPLDSEFDNEIGLSRPLDGEEEAGMPTSSLFDLPNSDSDRDEAAPDLWPEPEPEPEQEPEPEPEQEPAPEPEPEPMPDPEPESPPKSPLSFGETLEQVPAESSGAPLDQAAPEAADHSQDDNEAKEADAEEKAPPPPPPPPPIPPAPKKAAKSPPPSRKKKSRLALALFSTLFFLGCAGSGLYLYQTDIVARVPAAAAIYDALGIRTMVIGKGLSFKNITEEWLTQDGASILIVQGAVVNETDEMRPVPTLSLELADSRGVLQQKLATPPQLMLGPKAAAAFRITLDDPHPTATRIFITFSPMPVFEREE